MSRGPGDTRILSLSRGATATIHALGRSALIVGTEADRLDQLDQLDPTVVFRDAGGARLPPMPSRPHVYTLRPRTLADALGTIKTVGDAIGASAEAHALLHRLRSRIDAVALEAAQRAWWPRMVVLSPGHPPTACGRWVPELVGLAGAVDPLGIAGGRARAVDWRDVARAKPDVVVILGDAGVRAGRRTVRTVSVDPSLLDVACHRIVDGLEALARVARETPGPTRRK